MEPSYEFVSFDPTIKLYTPQEPHPFSKDPDVFCLLFI